MLLALVTGLAFQFKDLKTEVQVSLCEPSSAVAQKLELEDWVRSREFKSYLLDNRNMSLFKAGWSARVRLDNKNNVAEITLKKNSPILSNPMNSNSKFLDEDITKKKCEYDLHGPYKKLACKITYEISVQEFTKIQNSGDLLALFNKTQLEWLDAEGFKIPSNVELAGPFENQSFILVKKNSEIALDISSFKKTNEFIEISSRVNEDDEHEAYGKILDLISVRDLITCSDQQISNSRKKLEAFFNN